jgi:hypothetical protein
MVRLQIGKYYRDRLGKIFHVKEHDGPDAFWCVSLNCSIRRSIRPTGYYWNDKQPTDLDLVEEVDIGLLSGVSTVKRGDPSKQDLLSLSLNLPQGTETITLTQKVLVDGIEYIANIELEKV